MKYLMKTCRHLLLKTLQISNNERVKLLSLKVIIETGEIPSAQITLSVDDKEVNGNATGDGPVDAVFRAIENIVDSDCVLKLYSVNNITGGTDAQGEVTVRIEKQGRIINGRGSDTDIITASAKAYINAINRTYENIDRAHPQI